MSTQFNVSAPVFTPLSTLFKSDDFPALSAIKNEEDKVLESHQRECVVALNTIPHHKPVWCVADAANNGFPSITESVNCALQGNIAQQGSHIVGSKDKGQELHGLPLPWFGQDKERNQREHDINTDSLCHFVIDEILLNVLDNGENPGVMKILTGDGNSNGSGISTFPKCIERLLRFGWDVEIWTWYNRCSKIYEEMFKQGKIKLFYLDDFGIKRGSCKSAHCSSSYPGKTYPLEVNIQIPEPRAEGSNSTNKCCLRCGSNAHYVRNCPQPKTPRFKRR
jgi:hypothetical protein